MANGIDAQGRPVKDPTENVIDILDAAVKRIDDLRAAEIRRQDDLRILGDAYFRHVADLRASYDAQLREAESKRIDAIRAVDVGAVNRAAEVQAQQAQTLASQVTASAEALRNQVAAAATAATVALAAALEPISKDIADLRKSQYEALGQKTQVVETRTQGNVTTGLAVAIAGASLSAAIAIVAIIVAVILAASGP